VSAGAKLNKLISWRPGGDALHASSVGPAALASLKGFFPSEKKTSKPMQRRDPSYSVRWRGILRVKSVNTMAMERVSNPDLSIQSLSHATASPTRLETGREREVTLTHDTRSG